MVERQKIYKRLDLREHGRLPLDEFIAGIIEFRDSLTPEELANAVYEHESEYDGTDTVELTAYRLETEAEALARVEAGRKQAELRAIQRKVDEGLAAVRRAREIELNDPEVYAEMRRVVDQINNGKIG
jgi:FtsZ-interacting cell division protein YlmF